MAETVVFTATATSDGFRDDGAHRQAHAPIYRSYTRTDLDPFHDEAADGEDRHALLRVLLLTGFLADEFLAEFDAEQVIVLSASSKTTIGFADPLPSVTSSRSSGSPRRPTPSSSARSASTTPW